MKRLVQWWAAHFLGIEFALAVTATVLFGVWLDEFGGYGAIAPYLDTRRGAIYGTVASILGALLGFAITGQSILMMAAPSDRLAIVRESTQDKTLWRVFTAAIRALALATLTALIALVVDRDTASAPLALVAAFGTTLLATLRLIRLIWVLEQVTELMSARGKAREGNE